MKTSLKNAFAMFSRNDRWGTCVACPRDSNGNAYPEFCAFTDRYDHHQTLDYLVDAYNMEKSGKIDEYVGHDCRIGDTVVITDKDHAKHNQKGILLGSVKQSHHYDHDQDPGDVLIRFPSGVVGSFCFGDYERISR